VLCTIPSVLAALVCGAGVDDCVDDPDGYLSSESCSDLEGSTMFSCDSDASSVNDLIPAGTLLQDICPLTCGLCVATGADVWFDLVWLMLLA
jgi:hypothetical protein